MIHKKPAFYVLIIIILSTITFYLFSQHWIAGEIPSACLIGDALQNWTAPINVYLNDHIQMANVFLTLYSGFGDLSVLILIILALKKSNINPVLPLFIFLFLRFVLQATVSLPHAPGLIWHDPGFPSLFSDYAMNADFYFSAYVGINILLTLELARFKMKWLTIVGVIIILFEIFASIVLRAHFTPDIYTSIMTAFFCFFYVKHLHITVNRPIMIFFILAGIVLFFSVQELIAEKFVLICGIFDFFQDLFLPLNQMISAHPHWGDAILIIMNTILDSLTVFLLMMTIIRRDIRPFLGVILFFTLRQCIQLLVSLPLPPHIIWHYPGFPSLLQTYSISNDLYFSGHTGISLLAALEMLRFRNRSLAILGISLFIFEVLAVIILQVHYTMDVYTAIITVFCIAAVSNRIAPHINDWLARLRLPRA